MRQLILTMLHVRNGRHNHRIHILIRRQITLMMAWETTISAGTLVATPEAFGATPLVLVAGNTVVTRHDSSLAVEVGS